MASSDDLRKNKNQHKAKNVNSKSDDKNIGINCNELDWLDDKDTEAVLVTSASRHDLSFILKSIIDIDTVISIQKLVLEGKITPSY